MTAPYWTCLALNKTTRGHDLIIAAFGLTKQYVTTSAQRQLPTGTPPLPWCWTNDLSCNVTRLTNWLARHRVPKSAIPQLIRGLGDALQQLLKDD